MSSISVVIPAYNAGAFIGETLQSVVEQKGVDICDIAVCDDLSKDNTAEVVKSFADRGVRYLRNEKNLGPPGNFNRCLEVATGDYVALFHADDVMLPGNLAKKVAVLDERPSVGLVHSNAIYIDEYGVRGNQFRERDEDEFVKGSEAFRAWLGSDNHVVAPSVVMRRSVVEQVGRFEEGITHTQDLNYWLRAAAVTDVGYLAEPLILYRQHSGQDTKRYSAARLIREDFLARWWACRWAEREGHAEGVDLRAVRAAMRRKYLIRALNRAERELAAGGREETGKLLALAREIDVKSIASLAYARLAIKYWLS